LKTPVLSIVYFVIAAFLGALGQFLYKSGVGREGQSLLTFLGNARFYAGLFCYIMVTVLFLAAFKKGGSLPVLYPIYATTFIWAALISYVAYRTPIKPVNLIGMMLLVLGMFCMGR